MNEEKTTPDLGKKVKEEFQQWYEKQPYYVPYSFRNFGYMPFVMQQGVYLEFFREKGVLAYIEQNHYGWSGYITGIHGIASFHKALMFKKTIVDQFGYEYEEPAFYWPDYTLALITAIEAAAAKLEGEL